MQAERIDKLNVATSEAFKVYVLQQSILTKILFFTFDA